MAHPAEAPSAFNPSAKSVSQLKTADDLSKKLDSLKTGRQYLENQWRLNVAFYKGRQYSYFNRASRRLESLPVEDGEKPRWVVRLVSNQILAGAHSLLAKYTKTRPVMAATPGSGSDHDLKAAQMAEALLEYWWQDFHLDDRLEEALLWSIIAGQGYWKISWDQHAGKPMKFLLRPDGRPIDDDSLKDLFRANLQQHGVEPQEKTIYMGDIKVESISPFDVFLDPTGNTFDDCKYAICVHHLDPDEIYSRWGVFMQPDSVSASQDSTLPFSNAADASSPTVKKINIGYFKPTPTQPKGRYVVWSERPNKILEDGPWPYPFTELPLVKFPGVRIPGAVYDTSVVEHAIPLQKELNRTLSQIVTYKNLTINPRMLAPSGSIPTRVTTEPGSIIEYNPVGEHKPDWEQLRSMPPYIFDHLTGIRNALKELFGYTDITEGTPPPNVEAGVAIDLLQEMATDRLAPTIKLIEHALARSGQLMLGLAQEYYVEPRFMNIMGSGGKGQVKRFTQADIDGGITIRVEAGSGLPRTRAGRQARIMDFVDKQILRPDQAYKYLDLADMSGIAAAFRADEDQALREHDKIIAGQIINEDAYEQALTALETGQMADQQGNPIQDPQQAQEMLMHAGLQPLPYENFQQHLDTHALFMKSVEFESLPLKVKSTFIDHYNQTLQMFMSLPKPVEFQAVRPTLQIKTTAGPTAVAEMLNKAGITDITPQTMTEPPLETWVSDSVDKPNTDNVGNAKQAVDAAAGIQSMQYTQDAHAANQAQMAELHQARAHEAHAKALKAEQEAALAARTAREKRINPPRPKGK